MNEPPLQCFIHLWKKTTCLSYVHVWHQRFSIPLQTRQDIASLAGCKLGLCRWAVATSDSFLMALATFSRDSAATFTSSARSSRVLSSLRLRRHGWTNNEWQHVRTYLCYQLFNSTQYIVHKKWHTGRDCHRWLDSITISISLPLTPVSLPFSFYWGCWSTKSRHPPSAPFIWLACLLYYEIYVNEFVCMYATRHLHFTVLYSTLSIVWMNWHVTRCYIPHFGPSLLLEVLKFPLQQHENLSAVLPPELRCWSTRQCFIWLTTFVILTETELLSFVLFMDIDWPLCMMCFTNNISSAIVMCTAQLSVS